MATQRDVKKQQQQPGWKRLFRRKKGNGVVVDERAENAKSLTSRVNSESMSAYSTTRDRSGSMTSISRDHTMRSETTATSTGTELDEIILGLKDDTSLLSPLDDIKLDSENPPKSKRKSERHQRARNILSRQFGRTGLMESRKWVVEVSPAEWDGDESRWKYRILIQKRMLLSKQNQHRTLLSQQQNQHRQSYDLGCASFTTAYTWRSLPDFVWLEEALRAEYHGALILPLLSIAIGAPDLANAQYEVDANLLQNWLIDVLNGIRGQGELVLHSEDLISNSEAMEAFLYRNTDPLPIVTFKRDNQTSGPPNMSSTLDSPWKDSPEKDAQQASFVTSLWSKPFCAPLDNLCTGGYVPPRKRAVISRPRHLEFMRANCTSQALGDAASLQVSDSFVQYDPIDSNSLVTHSELLEAQRELILSYHNSSLVALDRLRQLKEEETALGGAWKRFAISLCNLFSYEKEVENSRVGNVVRDNIAYRKLSKNSVDELLRVMAKQKVERSTSPLAIFDQMLTAYVGDMASVPPSINAHQEAYRRLSQLDDATPMKNTYFQYHQQTQNGRHSPDTNTWQESFKSLFSMVEVKKGQSSQTATTVGSSLDGENSTSQRKIFEERVHGNERVLRDSLTALCKSTPVRAARMVHKYLNAEACQATLVSSAAISLRTKINIVDQSLLQDLKREYDSQTQENDKEEMELVQRIVAIGNNRKFKPINSNSDSIPVVEVDTDDHCSERHMSVLRDKALALARERIGRWDAHLALAIMEAVGIDDAEVQVEETTRDLRLVRRHAIGLRENLSRCVEAVTILKTTILQGDPSGDVTPRPESLPKQAIHVSRRDFLQKVTTVLSGSYFVPQNQHRPKSASPSLSLLQNSGIPTDDPAGWLSSKKTGKCGSSLNVYMTAKDVGVKRFLDQIEKLLEEYKGRMESIESYVYMQCVGIQLEKHFSKQRADALAAFEKKTDITTAINIARRKRLPLLVQELEVKLSNLRPIVNHTSVKEAKEQHLVSKAIKTEIGALALKRFQRARETAMDRVVSVMLAWANYEEVAASKELKVLSKAVGEIERSLKYIDVTADGISHAIPSKSRRISRGALSEA